MARVKKSWHELFSGTTVRVARLARVLKPFGSAFFSDSKVYMENPMYILNIHMGQTDRHFKNTQHLSDHLV